MIFFILACGDGAQTQYTGYTPHKYMPLDGNRTWRYGNDGMSFELSVEKVDAQLVDTTEIVTLEYAKHEPYELLATIDWSSDSIDGILIHGYTLTNQGGMEFDTPVAFADYRMVPGASIETTTNDITFTSNFIAVEKCPNDWVSEENTWDCLHFDISSDSNLASFPS